MASDKESDFCGQSTSSQPKTRKNSSDESESSGSNKSPADFDQRSESSKNQSIFKNSFIQGIKNSDRDNVSDMAQSEYELTS